MVAISIQFKIPTKCTVWLQLIIELQLYSCSRTARLVCSSIAVVSTAFKLYLDSNLRLDSSWNAVSLSTAQHTSEMGCYFYKEHVYDMVLEGRHICYNVTRDCTYKNPVRMNCNNCLGNRSACMPICKDAFCICGSSIASNTKSD
jgi:hypothetical protein